MFHTQSTKPRGEVVNLAHLSFITGKTRYQIHLWMIGGCPVLEVPASKNAEYKFNTAEVFDWLEQRREQKRARADRRRLLVGANT